MSFKVGDINNLHRVVTGMGKVNPDLSTIGASHNEYRLTMTGDASDLTPIIHTQSLKPRVDRQQGTKA